MKNTTEVTLSMSKLRAEALPGGIHIILIVLLQLLQASVKNPKSLQKEFSILGEIRDLIDTIVP